MIGLDGATLDVISPAVAEGRLPNFGRVLDGGAVLHLATLRPTQAETVWSAAATGRTPGGNGIRASALYRARADGPALELPPDYCFFQALVSVGLIDEDPHDARSLKARPLWSIVSDVGLPVAVVGFPLTHPAPPVNGVLISDELHRLTSEDFDRDGSAAVAPSSLLPDVRLALADAATPDPLALVSSMGEAPQGDADARPDPAPILADRMHLQLRRALASRTNPRLVALRLPGLDAVGHYYLRYANPSAFGDVSEAERNRYGRVLNEYYGFIDAVLGHEIDSLAAEDLLVVVSGFGMEPLSPGKRVLERLIGNARLSGTHERAPDGFLLAYGAAVAPGRPNRASVLDLTPTLLYYLGLPVARDMDGFALTDLFRDSFTASRPSTFIPSYGR
jgi:predicted AlkP superfamily phosphohydrolase/phosphomutase